MTPTKLLAAATAAATVLALSACSGDGGTTDPATSSATAGQTAAGQTDPGQTNAAEDTQHSPADVMFARMMIPHHEQAVEMSDMILAKNDIPADVRTLAQDIKAAQGPEIEQLNRWLEEWRQPTGQQGDDDDEGRASGGHSGHDMGGMDEMGGGGDAGDGSGTAAGTSNAAEMPMPMMEGMLSAQQLQELSDAQGTAAARLFMEQMIAHHEGAIDMAKTEVSDGTYPPAVDMARTIIDTQQAEIDAMRGMLAAL